jgi:hypothetical protein
MNRTYLLTVILTVAVLVRIAENRWETEIW